MFSIRTKYPAVADIHHDEKWAPGELNIRLTEGKSQELNSSIYGPIESEHIINDWFFVKFNKPYNAKKLAEILNDKFGMDASVNATIGASQHIAITTDGVGGGITYEFYKGWGDTPSGCIYKHFWTFTTNRNGSFKLVREWGAPLKKNVFSRLRRYFKRDVIFDR